MESITILGTNADGVSIAKTIQQEDGVVLQEISEAIRGFLNAYGFDCVEEVTFTCGNGIYHNSEGSSYEF